MKKRALKAIILAVICILTSLSVYASSTECSHPNMEYSCAESAVGDVLCQHYYTNEDGEEELCYFYSFILYTRKYCPDCHYDNSDTRTHREYEFAHYGCLREGREYFVYSNCKGFEAR